LSCSSVIAAIVRCLQFYHAFGPPSSVQTEITVPSDLAADTLGASLSPE
jgi:hypothetical protein